LCHKDGAAKSLIAGAFAEGKIIPQTGREREEGTNIFRALAVLQTPCKGFRKGFYLLIFI
jgi:hypothetical protein